LVKIVSMIVYSFGLASFAGLTFWVMRHRTWRSAPVQLFLFLFCAVWFLLNLANGSQTALLATACGFPVLLMTRPQWAWCFGILAAAVAAGALWQSPELSVARAAFSGLLAAALLAAYRGSAVGGLVLASVIGAGIVVPLALSVRSEWLLVAVKSLPLTFLGLDSFVRNRFLFWDLFVKWGSYFLIGLGATFALFKLVPSDWTSLAKAVVFLPLFLVIPKVSTAWGAWVDRHWLHRPVALPDMERLFLEHLQNDSDETSLLQHAVDILQRWFQADIQIVWKVAGEGAGLISIPMKLADRTIGFMTLGPRAQQRPYFSEDLEVLKSLARILAFLIENRRLESRRQELALQASQAELRALRAQINPHFLFNSLNAIASLIPTQPQLAEQTVERLSDIFRYSLSRADREWTTLSEELEFIDAYLQVEKARFGDRLIIEMEIAHSTLGYKIPSMTLHTLVENAMKHGVAKSSSPCLVKIAAHIKDQWLRLSVVDSGPGLVEKASTEPGHGLKNVESRLAGYFDGRARFSLRREGSQTRAEMEIPV
jgi:signal transduction histidine kinase